VKQPTKRESAGSAQAQVESGQASEPDPLWEALPTHADAPPPTKRGKPAQLGFDLTELDAPVEPTGDPNPYGEHGQ
jgi:hypothetical protein